MYAWGSYACREYCITTVVGWVLTYCKLSAVKKSGAELRSNWWKLLPAHCCAHVLSSSPCSCRGKTSNDIRCNTLQMFTASTTGQICICQQPKINQYGCSFVVHPDYGSTITTCTHVSQMIQPLASPVHVENVHCGLTPGLAVILVIRLWWLQGYFMYCRCMICCHWVLLTVRMPKGQVRKPCFNKATGSFTFASWAHEKMTPHANISVPFIADVQTRIMCARYVSAAHVGAQCCTGRSKSKLQSLAKQQGNRFDVLLTSIWYTPQASAASCYARCSWSAGWVSSSCAWVYLIFIRFCSVHVVMLSDRQFTVCVDTTVIVLIQCCIFVAPYDPDVWLSRKSTCEFLKQCMVPRPICILKFNCVLHIQYYGCIIQALIHSDLVHLASELVYTTSICMQSRR